jgi:hypothetical protein
MPELHGTITNVQSHVKTRKSDGKSFTLFEISIDGGTKYSTTDRAIGQLAYNLIGKFVSMTFVEKQNGSYTNLYVNDLVAIPIANNEKEILEVLNDHNSSYVSPTPSNAIPRPAAAPAPTPTPTPANDSREKTIWRQTATKVAAHLSTDYEKFWTHVDELIAFYETGKKPSLNVNQFSANDENQFIPKNAGNIPQAEIPNDDDIPF